MFLASIASEITKGMWSVIIMCNATGYIEGEYIFWSEQPAYLRPIHSLIFFPPVLQYTFMLYKTVPRQFYQLFKIFVARQQYLFPVCFIFMTRKTKDLLCNFCSFNLVRQTMTVPLSSLQIVYIYHLCTYVFRTCVFHPCKFILASSVLTFSNPANSYLRFQYLSFPSVHIVLLCTYIFRTWVFQYLRFQRPRNNVWLIVKFKVKKIFLKCHKTLN